MDASKGGSRFCRCTVFLIAVYFSLPEPSAFCSIKEHLGAVGRSSSDISHGTSLAAALPAVGGLGWCGQETSDSADEVPLQLFSKEILG